MVNCTKKKSAYSRLAALLIMSMIGGLLPSGRLTVLASKETEEKIEKAKEEKEAKEDQIESNQQHLGNLQNTRSSLQGELNNLNSQLQSIGENLNDLDGQIVRKLEEIEITTRELEEAQRIQDEQYEMMKLRVQFMYAKSRTMTLDALFGSESFGEFLNRQDYIEQLSAYDKQKLEEFIAIKESIDDKKALLENEQAELESLREEARNEQARVSGLVTQTSSSISSYEGQIQSAEETADQLQAELDAKNKEIAALEAQLAEERRLEALSRMSAWRNISDVTFGADDRTILANLIYCEAGNQPYEGQLGVGAVVINRVLSGAFPNTVVGVIYQPNQFSPVTSGRLALALARGDATASCFQAADAAMSGQSSVGDCIFFRTPIPQVVPRYTIGNHIFY